MCKVSSVFLMVGLFILLIFQTAFTTQPTIPSKKIDMNITFSSEPDSGKECAVTFSFTPLEEIEHKNELNDEASIYFYPEDGIEIISGVPKWEGRLSKGKTEIIQIVFKVTKPGSFQFDGVVKSCRVNPQFIRKNPKVSEKMAKKAYEKIFTHHNVVSKHFQIGAIERGSVIWSIDASTGEAKKVKIENKTPLIPPLINSNLEIIQKLETSTKELHYEKAKLSEATMEEFGLSINEDSIWIKKASSDMERYYTVNGKFQYIDNYTDSLPMFATKVAWYYWDSYIQDWVFEDTTHTDTYGNFAVYTNHSHVLIATWSINPDCFVFHQNGRLQAGPMYAYGLGVEITGLSGNFTIPRQYTTEDDPDRTGAFGILPVISKGRKFIENVVGWFYRLPQNAVYWDNASYQDSVTGFASDIQWNGVGIIVIKGRLIKGDRDQWDPDVILHEYAHLCMQIYAQFPPKSSGPHYYYWLPLPDTAVIFPNLAWSEGWAEFLGCAIDSTTPQEIWNLDNNNEVRSILDLETPLPDVPYYNTYWNQTGPSSSNPFYNGYDIEGAIAEALWDIYDQPNDGNWYNYNQIWGHNNDYNQYDSWRGINAMWDVFENYDPSPSDPNHNHCFTFYEFKKGWKGKGYPFEGHFSDILCAHNLDPTANNAPNIAGDANSDGSVTIADVVYLVNYLFKGGPAPEPYWKGDANGDCKVTASDIVYLINYLMKGGQAPICNESCWACRCTR